MQLLPSGAGRVSSKCFMGPGTGDWSGGGEGKAGVAAGRAPGQRRQEIFGAFRHFVIWLFIWEEKTTQEALVPIPLKITQWVLAHVTTTTLDTQEQ